MANHPTWKHESPRANRNIATVGGIIGAGGSLLKQVLTQSPVGPDRMN